MSIINLQLILVKGKLNNLLKKILKYHLQIFSLKIIFF